MYKSLLLACAFIAPMMAQDAPAPESASDKAPAARSERGQRGERGQRARQGMMERGALMEKLVLEKYDENKDGKLDDAEKAKVKEAAQKIREERAKNRPERPEGANARPNREGRPEGQARQGRSRGEGRPAGERGQRPEGAPRVDRDTMVVGHALLLEKYDTDKDGKLSEAECEVWRKDAPAPKEASAE